MRGLTAAAAAAAYPVQTHWAPYPPLTQPQMVAKKCGKSNVFISVNS